MNTYFITQFVIHVFSELSVFLKKFQNRFAVLLDVIFLFFLDFSAMTQNVALAINMGSPFTGDGLRPVMPNVVRGSYF